VFVGQHNRCLQISQATAHVFSGVLQVGKRIIKLKQADSVALLLIMNYGHASIKHFSCVLKLALLHQAPTKLNHFLGVLSHLLQDVFAGGFLDLFNF